MLKRKMVFHNLVNHSIAAYFAAIEIHNKPNISYRYETVALLLINAWELILKAFIRKKIKMRSIFAEDGHTISLEKALKYVYDYLNIQKSNSFLAVRENILLIEGYRNNAVHFYNELLESCIFALIARCALNFVEFLREQFSKDIMESDGLFIMPLGFKLPFRPEDFLSKKASCTESSKEAQAFINSIVTVIESLNQQGVEESVVLGFDVYLQSVKKVTNSDLLVAITSKDEAEVTIAKVTNIRLSNDPTAQVVSLSDKEIFATWKHTYQELADWCRKNISDFKQNKIFNDVMRNIESDPQCVYRRRLNVKSTKSAAQKFYSDFALDEVKRLYEEARARAS